MKTSAESAVLAQVLRSGTAEAVQQLAAILRAEELGVKKRPVRGAVGFFEQGIITGLGLVLVPVLAGMGVMGWYGAKTVVARWR